MLIVNTHTVASLDQDVASGLTGMLFESVHSVRDVIQKIWRELDVVDYLQIEAEGFKAHIAPFDSGPGQDSLSLNYSRTGELSHLKVVLHGRGHVWFETEIPSLSKGAVSTSSFFIDPEKGTVELMAGTPTPASREDLLKIATRLDSCKGVLNTWWNDLKESQAV